MLNLNIKEKEMGRSNNKPSKEVINAWHKDASNWICGGFIYYNKEDKRWFPPKRNPAMGWTINFANKKSILAFIILLLAIMVIAYAIKKTI